MNVVHVVSERLEAANTSNVELRKTLQRHGLAVPEPVAGDSPA
jgi:hypothetical protein